MAPKGSTIIYSTCTFAPEENENVIDEIINEENVKLQNINLNGLKMKKGILVGSKMITIKMLKNVEEYGLTTITPMPSF